MPGCAWLKSMTPWATALAPRSCERKPRRCSARFNEAFWDEETGFYAFALDGEKQQILSVASNPGHCLWSGIVRPSVLVGSSHG